MWLTVAIIVAWVVLAVILGRRSQRLSVGAVEAVEQQRRAFAAIEAAVARVHGGPDPAAGAAAPAHSGRPRHPAPDRPAPRPAPALRPAPTQRPTARRRRPTVLAAAATLTTAVLAGAALAAWRSGGERAGSDPAARTPTGAAAPVAARDTPAPDPGERAARPARPTPAPPGVLDAGRELVVAYGRPAFRVTLAAAEPCWFAVTDPRPHPSSAGRTLVPGERVDLEVAGGLAVRLGNPAGVRVLVDDGDVELPVRSGVPRTVRFVGGEA
jgi:hypothetical protein